MAQAEQAAYQNPIERLVQVRHGEWPKFLLAFAYFFILLGGYFMLRPLRGTVASNNADIQHLLFTATFLAMLLLVPVFGFLVARFRRGQFIPAIYVFFAAQLVYFAWAFSTESPGIWVQRVFFVWLSVFNLFVVSIFWSFMADIFKPGQAQRLFGSIMAGGSLGAICGPLVTRLWVGEIGASGIMLACAAALILATVLAVLLGRYESQRTGQEHTEVIGGRILEGAIEVFNSRYLLLICLLMLSHNMVAAIMYQGLAVLVSEELVGFEIRTEFFSNVDIIVQIIAFSLQFFITSRVIQRLGMPRSAIIPPLLLAGAFVILGSSMALVAFAAAQITQRALNYGMLGPIKEMLFTVVDRETKFKAKNFIDTVIYRGSDVVASWVFKGLMVTGLPLSGIVFMYLPVMVVWAIGAWHLGKAYEVLKTQSEVAENAG